MNLADFRVESVCWIDMIVNDSEFLTSQPTRNVIDIFNEK